VQTDIPPAAAPPMLELSRVVKSFGAVVALRSGSLRMQSGSIHALIGENGAGKSTLVKIVAGLYRRDAGEFRLNGEEVDFTSTAQSKAAGIAVIYQEPTLFPDLSVTENVFMGRQPVGRFGRIDRKAMRREVESLFQRLGVRIDPDRPAEGLSIADQQVIEIAKAVSLDARVLIMDEPTAALSGVEVDRLFAIARSLRDEGRALLFISHRFDEVFDLCDTVTVMRDGSYIATTPIAETTADELVRQMVGRDDSGSVALEGRPVKKGDPARAMLQGIALVPEDRRKQGLVLESSVARNITLAIRNQLAKAGIITSGFENRAAKVWASRLEVKTNALSTVAATLSGGNQQKVVLGKWLATEPRVLIVDEPTRGIDVGTKAEVHRLLSELAGRGIGILMISSELPEVLGMADRVLVMREGRITAEIDRADATSENVMFAATHAQGAHS